MIARHIKLSKFFTPEQWQIVIAAAAIAHQRNWRIYAVGGVVRDCILKATPSLAVPPQAIKHFPDVDLAVEGDDGAGMAVAVALHEQFQSAKLVTYETFQTAYLYWTDFSLDLATTRTETYAYPGANPNVTPSTIQLDLYRRDFTINAFAVEISSLNCEDSQPILDLFDGLTDLANRQIKPVGTGSFAEDPRRIFRAVRFAVRFGFDLAPSAMREITEVTSSGLHDCMGGSRLKAEVNYILESSQAAQMLYLLENLGGLRCVHPDLKLPVNFSYQLRCLKRWLGWFTHTHDFATVALDLLLSYLSPEQALATDLHLTTLQTQRLQKLPQLLTELQTIGQRDLPISKMVAVLQRYDAVTLILAAAKSNPYQRRLVWQHLTKWQHVKSLLTGEDLKQLGYKQGKVMGMALSRLRDACLDGEISTKSDAVQLAKQLMLDLSN